MPENYNLFIALKVISLLRYAMSMRTDANMHVDRSMLVVLLNNKDIKFRCEYPVAGNIFNEIPSSIVGV